MLAMRNMEKMMMLKHVSYENHGKDDNAEAHYDAAVNH